MEGSISFSIHAGAREEADNNRYGSDKWVWFTGWRKICLVLVATRNKEWGPAQYLQRDCQDCGVYLKSVLYIGSMSKNSSLVTRAVNHGILCIGTVAHSCYEQVALMKAELQILVFVEARKSSEIVCKMIRQKLTELVNQFYRLCSSATSFALLIFP